MWQDPVQLLADALSRVQYFAASGDWHDPVRTRLFLERDVSSYFDLDFMAGWTARPYYQQMSPVQQERFRTGMQQRFIELIVRGMGPYVNPLPQVRFSPARLVGPGQAEVLADVAMAPGNIWRVLFELRWTPGGWKLFDASFNGISALYLFRQYLTGLVQQYGPAVLLQ